MREETAVYGGSQKEAITIACLISGSVLDLPGCIPTCGFPAHLLTEASLSTLAEGLDQRKMLEGGGQRRQGCFKPESSAGVHPQGKGKDAG